MFAYPSIPKASPLDLHPSLVLKYFLLNLLEEE
jgi:hypothetical protein